MKKEIIKYYTGNVITPLGRPSLVLVGQEFADKVVVEKYILFEEMNGVNSHIGEIISAPIIPHILDNLESFMDDQGLEHAKSIIFFEAFKERESHSNKYYGIQELKVVLRECTETSFLMYFRKKAVTHLNWMYNSTTSIKLKELIHLYKSFDFNVRKID